MGAMTAADQALSQIPEGSLVGLGTGRAATAFVQALGAKVRNGFRVRGVSTSEDTARLARSLGIDLVGIDDAGPIDVTIDGADEVDPALNLIKGYGGALVREKIVAAASKRLIILVGPEKLVPALGTRGRLPVEVVRVGHGAVARGLGLPSTLRIVDGKPFVTDNGNVILDCAVPVIPDPAELDRRLRMIPGVVGTGIFAGMADLVLVQDGVDVKVLKR